MSAAALEVLRPFVTKRIQTLVRGRLLDGLRFWADGKLRGEYTAQEVKLSLLLVKIANPAEELTADEQTILKSGKRLMSSVISTRGRK